MTDTIAALATPAGKGGIAIVRISGPKAHAILSVMLRRPVERMREMSYRGVYDGERLLDRCLCVTFEENDSYTGEECAEIQCHGGCAVAADILETVLSHGVRMAEAGEFTKRAFLNGKIDLSQAEAVSDVIDAETVSASRAAARLLTGELGEKIRLFQDTVKELLTTLDAAIDYPDEMDEDVTLSSVREAIDALLPEIDRLIEGYRRGRLTRDGLRVCLIGKPNAGKSSLMNALCGSARAIVTAIPGTTRDVLHETLDFDGMKVRLYDTAGIRESDDEIERAGVERSMDTLEGSDVVLCVIDGSSEEASLLPIPDGKIVLYVINKADQPSFKIPALPENAAFVCVSALTGLGMEDVRSFIARQARSSDCSDALTLISARHAEALRRARNSLSEAKQGAYPELVGVDLTDAWSALGEITGETVTEDVVSHIFEKFCVGK